MPAPQPAPPAPSVEDMRAVIVPFADLEGPLLPMLHGLQDAYGCIPEGAVELLAETLNISRAETHGVISFYHDFKSVPDPRLEVKLCRAEACQALGSARLEQETRALLDADSQDRIAIEPVYCLGLCANGPAALVQGQPVARLDAPSLVALLKERGA
ncbi:MAG: NAD(P)H-dependent oxidoreductase subunit E [Maritimibacter sp.]